jgi:hypothetical protein
VENDWRWHKLTNIVCVDQPVGAGFSQGTVTATDEFDVAQQFMGFWKNFVDIFSMQGYKVYVTSSSYSGMYCPHIASAMLLFFSDIDSRLREECYIYRPILLSFSGKQPCIYKLCPLINHLGLVILTNTLQSDKYPPLYRPDFQQMLDANYTTYFNVIGMQAWDGTFGKHSLTEDIPTATFVDRFKDVFSLNDTFTEFMHKASQICDYTDYISKYLVYPAVGSQPANLPGQDANNTYLPGFDLFDQVFFAVEKVNPCFSPYSIFHSSPLLYDPLRFSDGYDYIPAGPGPVYLYRPDVKAAINAPPDQTWIFCSNTPVFVNGTDNSLLSGPASQPVLPNIIDRTQNVIIGHGSQDFVLLVNATLMMIQNPTFGGQLGFQTRPTEPFFIPYQSNNNPESTAGGGIAGIIHTGRGLTFLEVNLAGHFLTMDAPAAAFPSLEVLLGRIDSFQSDQPFPTVENSTTQLADAQSAVNIPSKVQMSGGSTLDIVGICRCFFWAGIPISVAMAGLN